MTKCTAFLASLLIAAGFTASAAYQTAGNYSVYTFETLSQTDGSGVTKDGDAFVVASDIEIAATDTLRLLENETVKLGNDVLIKVLGYADFKVASSAVITRNAESDAPQGFYIFEANACGRFENVNFYYAGLRTFGNTNGITVRNCSFSKTNTALTSTGAISLGSTNAGNIIEDCTFIRTESGAIGGSANGYAGATVRNCTFYECNTGNSNRPVINLTVGADNEIVIENNNIYGGKFNMVGGIGVSNMLANSAANVVKVTGNYVQDSRYGFTSIGPMDVTLENNTFINNHYEANAMNGGSGLSLYDPYMQQKVRATGNYIEGSYWGITVIGCGNVNLGKTDNPDAEDYNPGLNVFVNNSNGGVLYDLYNNSKNTVYAQGNMWNVPEQTAEEIAKVITDKSDIATLGEVIYDPGTVCAVRTAPQAVTATQSFDKVTLKWQAPTAPIELKWHDGEDYNGFDGVAGDPQGMQELIMASRFTADELKASAFMVVDSIDYFEYRDFAEAYAQIYENGKLVRNQPIDLTGFVKNSWRKTRLAEPYVVSGNDEVIFAIKYKAGTNQDFTAITDRAATQGKGNLVSYDNGATWNADGPGDFLITAHLRNIANTEPAGYIVSADGNVVSGTITDTSFTIENSADGEHIYTVEAIYADDNFTRRSEAVSATTMAVTSLAPSPATISGSIDNGLNGTITWQAPLKRGEQLTWSNQNIANSIGATASSPKIWVKQEFDANDLIAYPSHKITAVNAWFVDNAPTAVTVFVLKDGKIAYYEAIPADNVAAITPNGWTKFTLAEPFVLEAGSKYAFGYYCTHAKGLKPIAVDDSEAINGKGNAFSTSSPSSKGFDQSSPSWKTLASGDIAGNFALTADVEAIGDVAAAEEITGYNVYADGQLLASDVAETTFSETVEQLGAKTYSVVAVSASGKTSPAKSITLKYTLPAEYVAPKMVTTEFDAETGKVDLAWSNESVTLSHHGAPKYTVSFDEDLDIAYGAKFSADELSEVAGYQIYSLSFITGAELASSSVAIYADNEMLWSYDISGCQQGYIYNLTLSNPVTIPAGKNIYLAYKQVIPAGTSAVVIDEGPAVDGGAVVSYNNGNNWLAASAMDPDLAYYNFCISAEARPAGSASEAQSITIVADRARGIAGTVKASHSAYGIEAAAAKAPATRKAAIKGATVAKYRVYRNGEVIAETEETSFSEVLNRYGEYGYAVTNVYANGWESAKGETFYVANHTPQLPEAPYNLRGEAEGSTLNLTWDAIDADAAVLKYHNGNYAYALGMTSSYNEGYHTILFTADNIATMNKQGEKLTHIKFHLSSTEIDYAAAIVMVGNNVVYEQTVDVADLVTGWNTVRLDTPFTIPAGFDVKIGYHLKYAKGIKPLSTDDGPAVAGFGDLISSSTSTWYSLATKYNLNYNFLIEGICQSDTQVLKAPAQGNAEDEEPATTFSVYCDGVIVASGITEQSYSIASAANGAYTVTATTNGVESAHSNAVDFTASGVEGIATARKARYDRTIDAVVLAEAADAKVYTAGGALVKAVSATDYIDMSNLPAGAYIVKAAGATVKVVK
ncbi:MAG: hypothetical protein ACI4UN_04045 [Muribaculaceae bacterium]